MNETIRVNEYYRRNSKSNEKTKKNKIIIDKQLEKRGLVKIKGVVCNPEDVLINEYSGGFILEKELIESFINEQNNPSFWNSIITYLINEFEEQNIKYDKEKIITILKNSESEIIQAFRDAYVNNPVFDDYYYDRNEENDMSVIANLITGKVRREKTKYLELRIGEAIILTVDAWNRYTLERYYAYKPANLIPGQVLEGSKYKWEKLEKPEFQWRSDNYFKKIVNNHFKYLKKIVNNYFKYL